MKQSYKKIEKTRGYANENIKPPTPYGVYFKFTRITLLFNDDI